MSSKRSRSNSGAPAPAPPALCNGAWRKLKDCGLENTSVLVVPGGIVLRYEMDYSCGEGKYENATVAVSTVFLPGATIEQFALEPERPDMPVYVDESD